MFQMWACALGKIDAALTLYHWNASPLRMCNKDGLLPLTLARQRGHYNLANQVRRHCLQTAFHVVNEILDKEIILIIIHV